MPEQQNRDVISTFQIWELFRTILSTASWLEQVNKSYIDLFCKKDPWLDWERERNTTTDTHTDKIVIVY